MRRHPHAEPPSVAPMRLSRLGLTLDKRIDETHKYGKNVSMKTNIDIDERLVRRAQKLTGLKTKKELVNHALSELIRRGDQKAILQLRGKISWFGDLEAMREGRF